MWNYVPEKTIGVGKLFSWPKISCEFFRREILSGCTRPDWCYGCYILFQEKVFSSNY